MPQARWLRHSNGRLFRIPTGFPNSINKAIFSWLAAYFSGQSCVGGGRLKHTKSCSNPTNRVAAAVFPQQKTTGSVLADPSVFTSFKQFFWLAHPKLHTAFSGLTQWPTFVKCGASTHTAAVPSGTHTRFSILLWCCYHIHKHLNGIFTCVYMIHNYPVVVNRKWKVADINRPLQKHIWTNYYVSSSSPNWSPSWIPSTKPDRWWSLHSLHTGSRIASICVSVIPFIKL